MILQPRKEIALSTALGPKLLFASMQASEELGRLYELEVHALSPDPGLDALDLLGKPAGVSLLLGNGSLRQFHGIVTEMGPAGAASEELFNYRLTLRPALWLLTRRADTRIFQALSVPDILKQVFDAFQLEIEFKLQGSYAPREYCVQYRESDFNFVSRLMEDEGIYYFFRHEKSRHVMVLVDAPGAHAACPGQDLYRFTETHHQHGGADTVLKWKSRQRIETGQVMLTDYDWMKPAASLRKQAKADGRNRPQSLEIYDIPFHYTAPAEGERYAGLRLQEQGARARLVEGGGPVRALAVGHRFTLKEHPQPAENGEYLTVATSFDVTLGGYSSADGETKVECRFLAIPSKQVYRSERTAARTRVPGPQTARVVGPAGEEIYTDQYGRVKVHFAWDRLGAADEKSSCFVRVATPWAGAGRGWISVPRIGDEVVVDFIEGDPDRPLITGSVYNATNMPPWALPANKTQSGLLTRSSKGGAAQSNANALRFEDKKGSEQVWLHAEKNQDIEVENDETHWVGHDRSKTVDHDETTHVKHDRTETVDNNESITIGVNRSESVGKNEDISIGDNRSESVGKNETISIGKNRDETVGENENLSIGKNREHSIGKEEKLTVGDNRSTQVGKDDKMQVGKKWVVQAGDEISFVTGSASITMKKDGTISIKGKDITITGSGKIGIKASSDVVIKGSKIAQN